LVVNLRRFEITVADPILCPSSNIALTRQLLHALSHVCKQKKPRTPSFENTHDNSGDLVQTSRAPTPSYNHHGPASRETIHSEDMLLLPKACEIERLLHIYFSTTGLLFPFVHEETFMRTYMEVKESKFTAMRRSWLVLSNMMFAMAHSATTSQPANERIPQAMVFYKRAAHLSQQQMLRGTSLEIGPSSRDWKPEWLTDLLKSSILCS
jgi:hypothetical protein